MGRIRSTLPLLLLIACAGDDPPATATLRGFVDRAREAGIAFRTSFLPGEQGENFKVNLYDHGSGVAVADCDSDGDDDIYFCNQLGANALYRNNGDGTFSDITAAAGPIALKDRISVAAAFGDIDNDGDQDLFVISTRGGNALFRNEGGIFTDVTGAAGVAHVGHSQSATFFDPDHDGDLDLFVTNTARWTTDTLDPVHQYYPGPKFLFDFIGSPIELNVFYRNNGDGTFTNSTYEAGLDGRGWGGDTAVFDYDEDGDSDLFVASMFGASFLYRNDGKGRFEDVTKATIGRFPWGAMGARAFDYSGDGHLDLFIADMHSDMWMDTSYPREKIEPKRKYDRFLGRIAEEPGFNPETERQFAERTGIRYADVIFGNALYRWAEGGRFEEVSDAANAETFWPWGVAEGDFDNDGFEDAFLASGMGYPFFHWPSPLLMNRGDGTFEDRASTLGLDPPPGGRMSPERIGGREATRSSRSAATADFDGDGGVDLIVNNFNDRPFLLMNGLKRGNYVAFRLTGQRTNRDAIGARVELTVGGRKMVRQVQAAGGYLSQSSKTLHFGIGDATSVTGCAVIWPGLRRQSVAVPAINRRYDVAETPD